MPTLGGVISDPIGWLQHTWPWLVILSLAAYLLWRFTRPVLHRVVWGRWGWESLAAWAFALNACFYAGFYAFLFGVGLGFFVLALAARPSSRPWLGLLLEAPPAALGPRQWGLVLLVAVIGSAVSAISMANP